MDFIWDSQAKNRVHGFVVDALARYEASECQSGFVVVAWSYWGTCN